MKNFFDLRRVCPSVDDFFNKLEKEKTSSVFGAVTPLKVVFCASAKEKILYITSDFSTATKCFEMFSNIFGDRAGLLRPTADNFIYARAKSSEVSIANSVVLSKLALGELDVIVAPISAVLNFYPNPQKLKENIVKIDKKLVIEPSNLAKKLTLAGYKREDLVSEAGQFSLRGDILDIYPIGANIAYRVDFFDRDIESISELDGQSMKKGKEVEKIVVYPCKNVFLEENEGAALIKTLEKMQEREFSTGAIKEDFTKIVNELVLKLDGGATLFDLDYLMPLVKNKSTIFDYANFVCAIDECKMVFDALSSHISDYKSRIKDLEKTGILLSKTGNFVDESTVIEKISSYKAIAFQKLSNANKFFQPKVVFEIKSNPVSRYTHSIKDLAKDLKAYDYNGYRNMLFAGSGASAREIKRQLNDYGVEYDIGGEKMSEISDAILPLEFASGFILVNEKIAVFGTYDFLPRKAATNKLHASRQNVFSVPKVGDYVVHSFHGIGICEGVQKLSGNFGTKDYVVVRYRDDDRLYVPIDQMDMLDRFSGAEAPKRLSKIGGEEFAKVKDKVKTSVKKLAFDLLSLYAEREKKKGFVYSKDNELQIEFENAFAYTETEDQLISISEIKKDMEEGKVMERLLCGDVGFGKTEVALRVAFKAILDNKQVAFLAPTTILSEQHFNTAQARMKEFGVRVAVLNRFRTAKEVKNILSDLKNGQIDLLVGTHRLLSGDVVFKDLGLIILDEEQKFGVEDKERMKLVYPNVDVLTLSATPIPRTLHMSLSGIRDVSVISTPPSERLPIATYVTELSDELIRDAINKELSRAGQVFILYNSVEKIYGFAERVKKIVPSARIIVGHGQMKGKELEDVVYKFYHGEADVLVCTTIIENGIDIENANTLIVCDSDKFGLSQLYQLRGRVGRGNKMAYAYFTYDGGKVLTEEAYKRLDAISEFTEFGSGFKLAMRDLEIRGSGNVLGAEQHGHLEKVGYELYSKLLSEAVSELRGGKVEEETDVLVKIAIDAFIPDNFITKSEDRMVAYKTIASIKDLESKNKVISNLQDAFGRVPKETMNLIEIAYLKSRAKKIHAKEIVSTVDKLEIIFEKKDDIVGNEMIGDLIYKYRAKCSLDFSKEPKICFNVGANATENLKVLNDFLSNV